MIAGARHLPRCRRQLSVALHEAAHTVIALALAAPVQAATAGPSGGSLRLAPRPAPATPPSPPIRGTRMARALATGAVCFGGSVACLLRMRSRGGAIGREAARMSNEDFEGATEMVGELVACNVPYVVAWQAIPRFTEAILIHHARPLPRLALALARRGEMTGTEIAAIVPEVRTCNEALRLLAEAVRDLLARYPPPSNSDIEEVRA